MSAASRVPQREMLVAIESLASSAAALLQELVRIPSVTGDEAAIQRRVIGHLQELGLETDVWCPTREDLSGESSFSDDGLPLGERPVVVGRLPGAEPERARSLILNGHVDVVPAGDEASWQDDPWSGTLREGRVFGRGSCDMKGGLVSGFLAIAGLLRAGARPRGDLWIQSVIGEETGGAGTLAAVVRGYRADAAIVLEPTRLRLCPVGAGAASFRLHVTGQSAHAAMRREGVSAIEKLYPLLTALQQLEASRNDGFRHPLFDPSQLPAPISIGKVLAGDWPSTVPGALVAEGRHGILPGETLAAARASLETAVAAAAGQDDWLKDHPPRVEWFEGQFEPAETPPDSPILSVLGGKHTTVCGRPPAMEGVPYGSDLRFFTNRAAMPAVLYGPGDVRLAHSVDESVPLAEVITAAKVVALTIHEWCG